MRKWLKDRREGLGMTQKELADKCECKQNAISEYENSNRVPDLGMSFKLADALNMDARSFKENRLVKNVSTKET